MGFSVKPRTILPTKLDEDPVNYFNKTEQLKDQGYSKIVRLRNTTDLDDFRDKTADRTEWQGLVEKLGEATGKVDYSDESTMEAEDYYYFIVAFCAWFNVLMKTNDAIL